MVRASTNVSDYGKGPGALVDFDGQPMFAEAAVTRVFRTAGWHARWMASRPCEDYPKPGPLIDPTVRALLDEIQRATTRRSGGCWDVLAWRDDSFGRGVQSRSRQYPVMVAFAELKRQHHDVDRESQRLWLDASLSCGVPLEAFTWTLWDFLPNPLTSSTG